MKNIIFFLSALAFLYSCNQNSDKFFTENMQCEYLVNPIGIDASHPRFTWQIKSDQPGISQNAVKVFVGTKAEEVARGKGNVWESGTLLKSVIPLVYFGPELKPFTRYFWSVRVQNRDGGWSPFSEVAFFETGMMQQNNWKGAWISDTYDYNIKPAPYFRKEFTIQKKIKNAR
ncbi:MAG TPA: hypothetical protein VKA38_00605, partial [Draconibacterium sp.]|nr:hypothetical protein [Draconibacterium sp.]